MTPQNYGAFDQALIQLLADSRCPDDHLNLVKHIYNRPGPQGRLLQLAERDRNHHKATSLWPRAQQFLLDLAQGGNPLAMFHLGRWHRLGIGCNPNPEQATQWCEMGAQLGHTGCMITLARLVLKESPEQARAWLQQAQQQGDPMVHAHWSQCFADEADEQLALGVALKDPTALLFWSDHIAAKDPAGALAALYQAAEHHISEACVRLSYAHGQGQLGVPESADLALHWAAEAADLGNAFGCGMYGRLLVRRNPLEAISQMRRSVLLGEPFFIYELSRQLLLQGKRPNQLKECIRWLRLGAQANDVLCMNMLGDLLRQGQGCKANPTEALKWHEKAAALGDPDSQVSVAIACMWGEVTPQDQTRAFNLLHLASLQEDPHALFMLGLAYERGDGTEKNLRQAHACYQQAAQLGSVKALLQVGMNHFWGEGIPQDVPEGAKWIKQAADQGSADAQVFLGYMFRSGTGVTKNKRLARKWLQRAADQNHASGQYELAMLLESMDDDTLKEEVRRWMSAAAAQGHEEAKAWIEARWPNQPEWLKKLKAEAGDV